MDFRPLFHGFGHFAQNAQTRKTRVCVFCKHEISKRAISFLFGIMFFERFCTLFCTCVHTHVHTPWGPGKRPFLDPFSRGSKYVLRDLSKGFRPFWVPLARFGGTQKTPFLGCFSTLRTCLRTYVHTPDCIYVCEQLKNYVFYAYEMHPVRDMIMLGTPK